MKLSYDPTTDSLYIDLNERTSVDSDEVAPGVVIDLDQDLAIAGGQGRCIGLLFLVRDLAHVRDLIWLDALPLASRRRLLGRWFRL